MRARLAWSLAALSLALVVADAAVTARYRSLTSEAAVAVHGFPFVNVAVLGCAVMGAVVVTRYERHVVGWLLTLVGTTSAVSLLAEAYAVWVVSHDGPGSAGLGRLAGWISTLLGGQLAISGLALLFLLAPDGHLLSPRWRYAAFVTGLGVLLCLSAVLTADPFTFPVVADAEEVGPVRNLLLSTGFLLITTGLVASLVSVLLRLRRSRGEARLQVRLIALAAAFVCAGLIVLFVVQLLNGGRQTWAAAVPLFASYMLLPILFAVAVLRYRLYDVDLIINRTVVLGVGTAFAAVGYTTLVVTVGKVVDQQTSGFWLSLSATALVALAFQPLRRRVVGLANRLAYGSRAQPYRELADLSRRLAEPPSPDTLLPTVAAAAGQALSARQAIARLDVPGTGSTPSVWGDPSPRGTSTHRVSVSNDGTTLGSIEVALPRGRDLRATDLRLLRDLADQAAVAFRNTAMEVQLAGHVAELDRTTDDLARTRERLIEADDTARRTLEAAISRHVLPQLTEVAAALGRSRTGGRDRPTTPPVGGLLTLVNKALESLRELTRGVFPTQLARAGLEPALRSALARSGVSASLVVDPSASGRRFSPRIETAAYFCCVEAVRVGPGPTRLDLSIDAGDLVERIAGAGLDGVSLQGIADRVHAVGGSLRSDGEGLDVRIPVAAADLPR